MHEDGCWKRYPGVVVEIGRFHSLEATDELSVVYGVKAGHFDKMKEEDIIDNK